MRCLIVHNLRSGFGSKAIFDFERALIFAGDEIVLHALGDDESAADALRDAEDYDLVVLSGGDGTTTNLLYALRYRGVPACVFPSGTANLYCINLGNSVDPASLAHFCRVGATASTDLGEVMYVDEDGKEHVRGFSIMMGTGFDAQIMKDAVAGKQVLGESAYFAAALANAKPTVHHFKITVDGEVYERDGISCLIANNATIQGDIRIVPDGRMDDGLLDVIMLEQTDAVGLLKPIVASLMDRDGTQLGRPQIEMFRGRDILIEPDQPVPLEYDGEPAPGKVTSYHAHVLAGANSVIVSPLSAYHDTQSPYNEHNPRFGSADIPAFPSL